MSIFFSSRARRGDVKARSSFSESTPFNLTQPRTMNQLTWVLRRLIFVRMSEFTRTIVHLSLVFFYLSDQCAF